MFEKKTVTGRDCCEDLKISCFEGTPYNFSLSEKNKKLNAKFSELQKHPIIILFDTLVIPLDLSQNVPTCTFYLGEQSSLNSLSSYLFVPPLSVKKLARFS